MICRVLGKYNVSGTSKKTGEVYNMNVVNVTYKSIRCEGLEVESVWLPADRFPLSSIQLDSDYYLERDGRGYLVSFEKVKN